MQVLGDHYFKTTHKPIFQTNEIPLDNFKVIYRLNKTNVCCHHQDLPSPIAAYLQYASHI